MNLIISLRPKQWIKNIIFFAGIIFSRNLFIKPLLVKTLIGFIIFCISSSAIYLFNDIIDKEKDAMHPTKAKRPIPSGKLDLRLAYLTFFILSIIAIIFSYILEPYFFLIISSYIILMTLYSLLLKRLVIMDILVVATGFLLRAIGGAVLIKVEISVWLFICVFLLSLLIATGKRRHEIILIGNDARDVLSQYSPTFLDQIIGITTSLTIISYILYTVAEQTIAKFHTKLLILTIPFVLYGIFRYLWIVYHKKEDASLAPEEALLVDKPLLISVILWIIAVILIIR